MILFHCTTLKLRNLIIFFKGGQHGVYFSCTGLFSCAMSKTFLLLIALGMIG